MPRWSRQRSERDRARLSRRLPEVYAAHRRRPTSASWYELGCLMAEAYGESREFAQQMREQLAPRSTPTSFNPLTCWKQAVKLDPRHADAWFRLGQTYAEIDRPVAARRCLTKLAAIDPTRANDLVEYGITCTRTR